MVKIPDSPSVSHFKGINWETEDNCELISAVMSGLAKDIYVKGYFGNKNSLAGTDCNLSEMLEGNNSHKVFDYYNQFYTKQFMGILIRESRIEGLRSLKSLAPRMKDVLIELSKEKKVADGYSIMLSDFFHHEKDCRQFTGLFLNLVDDSKYNGFLNHCVVGMIGIRIGYPFEIMHIQGLEGDRPTEFYKKTGKHFDDVLIRRLIEAVGCNMLFETNDPKRKIPKILFETRLNNANSQESYVKNPKTGKIEMIPKLLHRARPLNYMTRTCKLQRIREKVREEGSTEYVRHKFFAPYARKALQLQKI